MSVPGGDGGCLLAEGCGEKIVLGSGSWRGTKP